MLSTLKDYLTELKSDQRLANKAQNQSELANDSNSFQQKTINPR